MAPLERARLRGGGQGKGVDLRRRAEPLLKKRGERPWEALDKTAKLAYELSIYPVKLEAQNEELRRPWPPSRDPGRQQAARTK